MTKAILSLKPMKCRITATLNRMMVAIRSLLAFLFWCDICNPSFRYSKSPFESFEKAPVPQPCFSLSVDISIGSNLSELDETVIHENQKSEIHQHQHIFLPSRYDHPRKETENRRSKQPEEH